MASQWYYAHRGQRHGPVSEQEFRRLAATGALQPTDLVWQQGMKAWEPAAQIKGLFPSTPASGHLPPPLPARGQLGSSPAVSSQVGTPMPWGQVGRSGAGSSTRPFLWWGIAGVLIVVLVLGSVVLLWAFLGEGPTVRKLTGDWRWDAGLETVTVSYSKDHTYVIKLSWDEDGTENGDWKLNGKRLVHKSRSSTFDRDNVGKEEVWKIVKLDDSELIMGPIGVEEEGTLTFQRVR
jgi:hypothetical protein